MKKQIFLLLFLLLIVLYVSADTQDKKQVFQERTSFVNMSSFAKNTDEVHTVIEEMLQQDFIQISIRPYISFKKDDNNYKYEINLLLNKQNNGKK